MENLFAKRLKELRTTKKIKQEELANILDVSQNTISNWEKNISEPSLDKLILLANYFEIDINYLLGYVSVIKFIDKDTQELLNNFKLLNKFEKQRVLGYIKSLVNKID